MIVIIYTTVYRKGGKNFQRAAETLKQKFLRSGEKDVLCLATETKTDVRKVFYELDKSGQKIDQLHFIGHSGMYGPMFGSIAYPEQFSPWEWEHLDIPFAEGATAWFRCCRSARWFAPFFAATFKVKTYGYYWYTAFSSNESSYRLIDFPRPSRDIYCFGCPGKKSHGIAGSLKKYSGRMKAEDMKAFEAPALSSDSSYDPVAELYAKVFSDIKVREDEWHWLQSHLPQKQELRLLDLGCGNGALLKELSPRIAMGCGLDESKQMIGFARQEHAGLQNISFESLEGPVIPYPDQSFDVVVSLLSFRYLDWDPILEEIKRVLRPDGTFLVIDMVTAPVSLKEYPRLLADKLRTHRQHHRYPAFYKALQEMVSHPSWREMLKHNPIRAKHEFVWYLESRFPGQRTTTLNIGYNSRILAFEGSIKNIKNTRLTYP
jgi:SAM-dependent methyltransferase